MGKYFSIKLLIFGKIRLCDVKNLTESIPKILLRDFRALSREI